MISFTYSDNSESVAKALANFQAALADNAPAFGEIADDFREMMAAQFASQGGAEGAPWAPRAGAAGVRPSHATRKTSRRERRSPLLQRTGALRDSLTRRGSSGAVENVAALSLALGSRVPYAVFHQLGTHRMPARPLLVLSEARAAQWTEFVQRGLEQKALVLGARQMA
jgi:phage gpG-like protein